MEPRPSPSSALWFAGVLVVVHVEAAQSEGRMGVWESEESAGDRLPLHVHEREDEQVVLLDGQIRFRVGDQVHDMRAGDTLALPRGVPHAHVVRSPKARILTVATPGGFERLFADLGVPAGPGTKPPPRPDTAAMAAAVGRLGVRILGPPLPLDGG